MTGRSVAVVGLGSVGAMTAWRLARRGARVTGYEQFSPGHHRGAHGGETRVFRTAYQESPDYVPLLRRAHELWRDLEDESGARLLQLNGVLAVGNADTQAMANLHASDVSYGLDLEPVPLADARLRYPQFHFADDDCVLLDRSAGMLRPELSVLHAALSAEALGATVRRYDPVTAIEPGDHHVAVRTEAGEARYDHVVVATGPWAAHLLGELGYPDGAIEVRRPVQAWFPARDPELFRPERCPVVMRVSGRRCYGLPALDGSGLKLGLSARDNRVVDDPGALDVEVGVDELRDFRAAAADLVPGVHPEPTRVGAYMEAYTPDGHGIVGSLPGTDRVTLLVGFSGHGFKLAPAFGDLGADSALGERTAPAIPQLDPARFLGRAVP